MLHLLKAAGYLPIYGKGTDETLKQYGDALFVRGRGESHQIDAIADYCIQPPFSNPPRLLVEAKFYDKRQVGLIVIRNAVGILNDVCQFFIAPPRRGTRKLRYHYQYAVVSATEFSKPSQKYAYAHDVFLIPLGASSYFAGLLRAIRRVADELAEAFSNKDEDLMGTLRQRVRRLLADHLGGENHIDEDSLILRKFVKACFDLNFGLIAVSESGFPIFLVPVSGLRLSDIRDHIQVRIYRDGESWYLKDQDNRSLFSFDLPLELFALYSEGGRLSPQRALDMKRRELNEMRAIVAYGESYRIIRFSLDRSWLDAI
ncbi:MAG: hypothetical protein MPW15_23445 [Candidatus Manganitrophus sp.]|nr:hypothetical protein [Candidatus Manganitrophus sp.]